MPAGGARTPATRGQKPNSAVALMALAVPGLAALLAEDLVTIPGVVVHDTGRDGRADVVRFSAERPALARVLATRLAEDLFVEAGKTLRSDGDQAPWIAGRIWRPERVRAALDAAAEMGRPVRDRTTFRVIARVLQERSFLRTDLRRSVADSIGRQQPKWRLADPADVEVWVVEYQPGKILAGLRVTDARMRQHDGRGTERHGALRPTVAAAMVMLAGRPGGLLLDPCCGSGTILAEAATAGWQARGTDIDPQAVRTAARNAPGAVAGQGDARCLGYGDQSVGACVSNLPFGKQFTVQQDMTGWLKAVLAELERVTAPGGRVVLLAPSLPRGCVPAGLRLIRRIPIRLLGTATTIWVHERR